jgi:hypothetical protein
MSKPNTLTSVLVRVVHGSPLIGRRVYVRHSQEIVVGFSFRRIRLPLVPLSGNMGDRVGSRLMDPVSLKSACGVGKTNMIRALLAGVVPCGPYFGLCGQYCATIDSCCALFARIPPSDKLWFHSCHEVLSPFSTPLAGGGGCVMYPPW